MKYKDYIKAWIDCGFHNQSNDCDCSDCRAQRELVDENPELFTAAEMKAARVETVERCMADVLNLDCRCIPDAKGKVGKFNVTRFAPMVDRNMVFAAIEKLKEEIKNVPV